MGDAVLEPIDGGTLVTSYYDWSNLHEQYAGFADRFQARAYPVGHQFDLGLAWVHFPEGCGGLGLSPKMNLVVLDEISNHSSVVHHDPPAAIITPSACCP